ncbi:hypothetical protein [Streptomyces heilongjiangensis]|uniref:Gliding motility protein n=1 Tax=Streptomyces heilongjiangensis TaxID=945052 RepID=A0ABW1BBU7_9ACTN|nr:hypothetical protein [Streptomyces heilongjiangensis]MDC2948977.1 hypothetical protein [Streptomyces heilongjiangensis]
MGVFSLFRRKTKGSEEAAEATPAVTIEAGTEEADEAKGPAEAARPEADTESEAKDVVAEVADEADDVEIPQQQTAEKAADNEAGEGART